MESKANNSNTSSNTEEKSQNSTSWPQSSRTRSHSSSVMPQSSLLSKRSKPTKSQLKPESEPFLQLTTQSLLVQPVWIHLKLTSSTPWTSQPRSSRVKLKSPRTSESVQLERRSRLQKLLFWRSSTSSHSSMVWELLDAMTVAQFFHKKSSTLTQLHCWLPSNQELRTWLVCHWKPVTQSKLLFLWFWPTHSETSLLCHWSQGTNLNNCRYKIKELDSLVSASQPVAEKPAEKPAAK